MSDILKIEKMTADDIDAVYTLHLNNSDDDPNEYVYDWLNETVDDPFGYLFYCILG